MWCIFWGKEELLLRGGRPCLWSLPWRQRINFFLQTFVYIAYQACLHIYCETKLKQISFPVHDHILLQITLAKKHFVLSRQKINFCVKWSKRVQMVQKWPQMVKNMLYWSFGIILGPLRPLWDIGKPAMFGHFWPQKGHFGPLCAHDWRMAMAKTASNQLGICLRIMHVRPVPKVRLFMAVTTKKVTEKAQK